MEEQKYNWQGAKFQQDPFKVPEGYFDTLSDRILRRIDQDSSIQAVRRTTIMRPWMAWVSGIAAALVIGWFGFSELYLKPHQELRFQEELAVFVDYYGEELHEGQLAGYFEQYNIEVTLKSGVDYQDLILTDPENTEELIYESIDF